MRGGGGAKAVLNFTKNSSNLVAGPFPYSEAIQNRFGEVENNIANIFWDSVHGNATQVF